MPVPYDPARPNMIPVAVGLPFVGEIPATEAVAFEFSAYGPELRLFFTDLRPSELVDVRIGDVYLGYLPFRDLAIIPWRFGNSLRGDAQFHVSINPPSVAVSAETLAPERLSLIVILVESRARIVLAVREVTLSAGLTAMLRDAATFQLAHPITRSEYDRQVDAYQRQFNTGADAVASAALRFEKT